MTTIWHASGSTGGEASLAAVDSVAGDACRPALSHEWTSALHRRIALYWDERTGQRLAQVIKSPNAALMGGLVEFEIY